MPEVELTIIGSPAPQGSKAFKGKTKSGHAILAESSKKVAPWRQLVSTFAYNARISARSGPLDGPLLVSMVFTLQRPKTAPKRQTRPFKQPDLDKLARSTCDALTDAGVWHDDAQVVEYTRLAKVYAGGIDRDALDVPGVKITVSTFDTRGGRALFDTPEPIRELK